MQIGELLEQALPYSGRNPVVAARPPGYTYHSFRLYILGLRYTFKYGNSQAHGSKDSDTHRCIKFFQAL